MEPCSLTIVLQGTEGDDTPIGYETDDTLNRQRGNDLLVGGAGADRLQGGEVVDLIGGWAANDAPFDATASEILLRKAA